VPTAFLGLGSNLGDRARYLAGAVAALREIDPQLRTSPVYETDPIGGPDGQGPYLNCVVAITSELTPLELLAEAHRLESAAGRVRRERWGPRTLDVDLLLVDEVECDGPELTLPHPRLFDRAFVLAPLAELEPSLVPENWRDTLGGPAAVEAMIRRVDVPIEPPEDLAGRADVPAPWS